MKRFKKRLVSLFAFWMVLGSISVSAAVFTPDIESQAALLVDLNTGRVLADKNGEERVPIASLSKMLVAYFIEEAVSKGDLSWDQPVELNPKLLEYSQDLEVSNIPLHKDEKYTVKDIMTAMMLPSSNSATVILADLVAGDVAKYNTMANKKLASWGIKDANWSSSTGLPVGALGPFEPTGFVEDDANSLSARETAVVAGHLLHDYPEILDLTSETSAEFPKGSEDAEALENTNKLLSDTDYTVKGLKTGSLPDSGKSLVSTTTIKGVPVLSVVLNAPADVDEEEVFTSSKELWEQAYDSLDAKTMQKGTKLADVPDKNAETGSVSVSVGTEKAYLLGKKETEPVLKNANLTSEVPYKAGQNVGHASWDFSDNDSLLTEFDQIDLQSDEDVSKANWFVRTWRGIVH